MGEIDRASKARDGPLGGKSLPSGSCAFPLDPPVVVALGHSCLPLT